MLRSLSPEQWTSLRALLDDALALPADRRAAWLDNLDEQHAALKPPLAALLGVDRGTFAQRLLETLPKVETDHFAPPVRPVPARASDPVGPYRLLHELGSGGMATVWLAERGDMLQRRRVALKLPHLGTGGASRAGLAERLRREREILAALNHPHIAQLFDAGVDAQGQPYLALEFVEGRRIDEYADQQDCDLRARLQLMLQVARAVAHAHAHAVVHRDLKPSNILVTAMGEVKLLDFGIAKLLDQDGADTSSLTQRIGAAMTPDYAAPEQLLGRPVGTAADVYALGVLLFELITGQRPRRIDTGSRRSIEESLRRSVLPRPSSLAPAARRRQIGAELDTLVLEALKSEPAERYATADALAEDMQRWLDGRPLLAQPDTAAYRLRKFAGRHRWPLAGALAVVLALLAGTVLALWQAHEARLQAQRAEAVKRFVSEILRDSSPFGNPAEATTAQALLEQARQRLQGRFADNPDLRVELLETLGTGLEGLSHFAAAEEVLQQAISEGRAAFGDRHAPTWRARARLLVVLRMRGQLDRVEAELPAVLADMRSLPELGAEDRLVPLRVRAALALDRGRYDEAETAARDQITLVERALGPGDRNLVIAHQQWALAASYRQQWAVELEQAVKSRQLALATLGPTHPRTLDARGTWARALGNSGHAAQAVAELQAVLVAAEARLGPSAALLAYLRADLARFQLDAGLAAASLQNAERARLALADGVRSSPLIDALTQANIGRALLALGRLEEALASLQAAHAAFGGVRGTSHPQTLELASYVALARAELGQHRPARQQAEILVQQITADPAPPATTRFRVLHHAGRVARLAGDGEAAAAHQRAALAALPDDPAVLPRRRQAEQELAALARQ